MTLSINIEQMARPVVNETGRIFFVSKFLHFLIEKLEFVLERIVKRMIDDFDMFILSIEGSYSHIEKLSPSEASKLLIETKKVIIKLDDIGDNLQKLNYFDSKPLKSKFIYMQKSVYKAESKLHRISFRDKETIRTENTLKEGVIRMNSNYTQNLLAK